MFTGNRNGPKEIIIPEQRYLSCMGCKYYSHDMFKFGHNPIYHHCNHDEFIGKNYSRLYNGNLGSDKTPTDCPILLNPIEDKLPEFFD